MTARGRACGIAARAAVTLLALLVAGCADVTRFGTTQVSLPEPPRGIVQLRRWRPNTIEYASGPEPGDSIGTSVW